MDVRTGRIYPTLETAIMVTSAGNLVEMELPLSAKQRIMKRVGRNDPCPCNSGKKFKKCCLLRRT